jgi:hypothetical protein
VADANGRRLHSWRVLILRELGYESLDARYRFDEPWDSPHNRALIAEMPPEFGCPSDPSRETGGANYVAVVGCQTIWPAQHSEHLARATDGSSNTLQVVESCDVRVQWTEPRDLTHREFVRGVNAGGQASFSSRHPGGACLATMYGDVVHLANSTDRKVLHRFSTPSSGSRWRNVPCDDPPLEYADDRALVLKKASELKQTDVLPVLDTPLVTERNLVYCSTVQIVWDDLRRTLGVDSLDFREACLLSAKLNAQRFPRDSLPDKSYVALAGRSTENVRNRFVAARQQKFPNATLPMPPPVGGLALEAYCYLGKRLPFRAKFDKLDAPLRVHVPRGVAPVLSFGLLAPHGNEVDRDDTPESQVEIVDYVNDGDFVLRLKTRSDAIVLAKVRPEGTLAETWRTVLTRVRSPRMRGKRRFLFEREPLVVPHIALFVERDDHELSGRPLVSSAGLPPIGMVLQFIKFQLDESGAQLESEASTWVGLGDDDDVPPDPPRQFVFDRPFLLALQQPEAEVPYFVLWVGNTELLIPADK